MAQEGIRRGVSEHVRFAHRCPRRRSGLWRSGKRSSTWPTRAHKRTSSRRQRRARGFDGRQADGRGEARHHLTPPIPSQHVPLPVMRAVACVRGYGRACAQTPTALLASTCERKASPMSVGRPVALTRRGHCGVRTRRWHRMSKAGVARTERASVCRRAQSMRPLRCDVVKPSGVRTCTVQPQPARQSRSTPDSRHCASTSKRSSASRFGL